MSCKEFLELESPIPTAERDTGSVEKNASLARTPSLCTVFWGGESANDVVGAIMSELGKSKHKYAKLFSKRCVLATAVEQYLCYHDGPVEARYSRAYSMKGTNLTLLRSSRTVFINDRDVTTSPPRSRGRGPGIDSSNSSILAAMFHSDSLGGRLAAPRRFLALFSLVSPNSRIQGIAQILEQNKNQRICQIRMGCGVFPGHCGTGHLVPCEALSTAQSHHTPICSPHCHVNA